MSKFKIEHSADQTFLVIQCQKGQQISEREYYEISNGRIQGLLRAGLVRKGNGFKLLYNISGYISLKEFLVNPLNKSSFARLLSGILLNLKDLQSAYYNYQYIMLDINAAMVNPATQQVSFVYVPITFYESGTNLKEFLLSIIQHCSFAPEKNTDYVRDYIRILNNGINFSIFDLEEYLKKLNHSGESLDEVKKCKRCGSVIRHNVNYCSSCGIKLSDLSINNPQGIYNPVAKNEEKEDLLAEENGVQFEESMKYTDTISGSYINSQKKEFRQSATALIQRDKTGEQVRIGVETFRIGKDPFNTEYCIRDNTAISRCHVIIKQFNGRWYINDLNSTNKTFINGSQISPNVDVELFDGTNIKLANENFRFFLIREGI